MKNNISVNAKYYKSNEISRIEHHNIHRKNVDYLLENKDITYKNKNIIYGSSNTLKSQFKKLQAKKYQILKKQYDYKHNKNENTLVEMVVAVSEQQAKHYLDNGIDLMLGFNEFAKLVKEKYGFEPIANDLHLDEGHKQNGEVKLNIHSHITFYNFDFDKNKTVLRTMKKEDWSNMQDLAEEAFNTYQMDFKRGESKDTTNAKHLERNDYIIKVQNEELANIIKDLEDNKKELKEVYTDLNTRKNEYKDIRNNYNKTTNIYKVLSLNVKNLQIQEKQNLRKDIKNYLNKHITKNDNKYIIKDMNKFYTSIIDEFENMSNIDVKIEELENLRESNDLLRNSLNKQKENNNIYKNKLLTLETLNNKIAELIDMKNRLDSENHYLKNFIKDKDLSKNYSEYLIKKDIQKESLIHDMV